MTLMSGRSLLSVAPERAACIVQVCSGEATAAKVTAWVSKHYTGSLHVEVMLSCQSVPAFRLWLLQPPIGSRAQCLLAGMPGKN